jgi:LacI family transcriptional regulator
MRLTMTSIAKRAGVSTTTVSRVINNKPDVDENTRSRILKIIEEANYTPNPTFKGISTNKTNLVGLYTNSLDKPWTIEVLKGVTEIVNESSYHLMLFNGNSTSTNEYSNSSRISKQISQIIGRGAVDGLVVIQPLTDKDYLSDLYNEGFPLVLIDDWGYMGDMQVPRIATDNFKGAFEATNYLINLGHTKIGFITGLINVGCSQDRLNGYKAALCEAGLSLDPSLIYQGDFSIESGFMGTQALLGINNGKPAFTSLFASSDNMALGAMKALLERGLQVPEDISLVGFDGIPIMEYTNPSITTVRQPMDEMGKLAVEMLIEQIEGKQPPSEKMVLSAELVVRNSTRRLNLV